MAHRPGQNAAEIEFLKVVNGAAGYFEFLKAMGAEGLDISESSIDKIRHLADQFSTSGNVSAPSAVSFKKGSSPAGITSRTVNTKKSAYVSCHGDQNADLFIVTELLPADSRQPEAVSHMKKGGASLQEGRRITPLGFLADPFEGAAGALFLKILKAMGLTKDMVFTMGIEPGAFHQKTGFPTALSEKVKKRIDQAAKHPEAVLTFGEYSARIMLGPDARVSRVRNRFHNYKNTRVMATYHPFLLLTDISKKRAVWEDVQLVMKITGNAV
ncbi:MAG: hypothetical protein U9P10_14605 [Thermodesulfobacteriota bacterium]|nr:hypothetical protein [Thermodesulfobacteriota bacterium]